MANRGNNFSGISKNHRRRMLTLANQIFGRKRADKEGRTLTREVTDRLNSQYRVNYSVYQIGAALRQQNWTNDGPTS